MKSQLIRTLGLFGILILIVSGGTPAAAQGAPIDLPCAHNASAEVLGKSVPTDANGMVLLSVRITIQPGGGFDAHTHPGTVVATIDSGTFGFTLLDEGMDMTFTRAADAGTPAATETVSANEEILLGPGDGFVETGMVHEAWNRGDEPVVVIVSALIQPDQPLTICADQAA